MTTAIIKFTTSTPTRLSYPTIYSSMKVIFPFDFTRLNICLTPNPLSSQTPRALYHLYLLPTQTNPLMMTRYPPPPFVPTGPTHLMPIPPLSPQLPPDAAADPLPPPLPTEPCRRSHQVRNPPITYNPTTGNPAVYCPSPRVTASLAQAQVLHPTFWCD